jgi:hypothetical protein
MMSETVIAPHSTDFRKECNPSFAGCVIYPLTSGIKAAGVLTTTELLARLDQRGVRPGEIAKVLGINPSRVTEIRKGERRVLLDEAAKLVAAFDLESPPVPRNLPVLPGPIARLIVRYIAAELGFSGSPDQLEELSQDVRAFAEFVADPKVRESVEAAEAFFQAMRLRRPAPESRAEPKSGPEHAH